MPSLTDVEKAFSFLIFRTPPTKTLLRRKSLKKRATRTQKVPRAKSKVS